MITGAAVTTVVFVCKCVCADTASVVIGGGISEELLLCDDVHKVKSGIDDGGPTFESKFPVDKLILPGEVTEYGEETLLNVPDIIKKHF